MNSYSHSRQHVVEGQGDDECGLDAVDRADLLNDLRVLIRRCRIKVAFNTSSDNGFELRVRHTLRNWGDGGLDLARHQACYHRARN